MAHEDRLKTLAPFLQVQGFVWGPEPEIYGGLAGFYTYGPNGTLLKRRIEKRIRDVFAKHEFFEVETPTVLPKPVWEASGHLGGFTDPLIKDAKGNVYRADHLLEEYYEKHNITEPVPLKADELSKALKSYDIKSPAGEVLVGGVIEHNLMMRTTIGTEHEAYNRPETATATYLPFLRYAEHFRKKLPFGVFQIGKAYRNEISPRQHLVRMREFTQAEAQLFIDPAKKDGHRGYEEKKDVTLPVLSWKAQEQGKPFSFMKLSELREQHLGSDVYAYGLALAYELFLSFGIPSSSMRVRQHGPDEKAFYAADAWDVEVNLPTFGWTEMCGVHDRTDYDLTQHAKHSGKDQTVFVEEHGAHITPHVLEIAFGVDRPVYALLDLFYDEKDEAEGKTTLKLPYALAPVHVAVLPLVKKLSEPAQNIYQTLLSTGITVVYDESGAIGKRYLRASTIGTPYCVTVDYDTLEDNAVTVRDRDTEAQERVPVAELVAYIQNKLG